MRNGRTFALVTGAALLAAACTAPASSPSAAPSAAAPSSQAPSDQGPSAQAPSSQAPSAAAGAGRLDGAELQARWWNWAASSPARSNPVKDPDGTFCAENQPGDVWFLAGSFGEKRQRTCSVPAGRPVAFPLVNLIADASDCASWMKGAKGTAVLDGRPLTAERYEGSEIRLTGVEGNPVTDGAGSFSGLACGLWVQIDPLSPGPHTLRIEGSSGSFGLSVGYELQVG
ncbi:signal protein [Streptomyces sp. NPDC048357]|uniref:signal protein n=1 Tax=Streptomyces sp. NPDC048357 TaxID=3154719 RepID=UPI003436D32E